MATNAPTPENDSGTSAASTPDQITDLVIDITPNAGSDELLCWQSYDAVVEAATDSIENACPRGEA